ncbi:MAG: hypothetical protein R6W96_02110, partial [Clostridia bacterium]
MDNPVDTKEKPVDNKRETNMQGDKKMLEFINHARKAAYREDASFDFLTDVRGVEKEEEGYVLTCGARTFDTSHRRGFDQVLVGFQVTDKTREARLRVDGAGERSFRIRYSRDGSFQNDTPMLDNGFFVTGIECVEREDALVFSNGKAVLEVERSPLAMRLKDGEGNTLLYMPGIQ